jgi:hypothetical protein
MSVSATIIEQVFYRKNLKQLLILHKLYLAIFAGCAHSPIAVVHCGKPHLAAQAPGDGFCCRHTTRIPDGDHIHRPTSVIAFL